MNEIIKLKGVNMEDFTNYKKPSMFLATSICDWKCCTEGNFDKSICQNSDLVSTQTEEFRIQGLYHAYIHNDITKAIVIGGLEPFLQFEEILNLITFFRNNNCDDDIVIYTGYYSEEIQEQIDRLKQFKNIIIKFGRFIPNQQSHFDDVLGINLISDNQFAEKIS